MFCAFTCRFAGAVSDYSFVLKIAVKRLVVRGFWLYSWEFVYFVWLICWKLYQIFSAWNCSMYCAFETLRLRLGSCIALENMDVSV